MSVRSGLLLTTQLFLAAASVGAPSAANAYDTIAYTLDFEGQQEYRKVLNEVYKDFLDVLSIKAPDQPVLIGIGAIEVTSGALRSVPDRIVAYFDHPATCDATGCLLVILYPDLRENQWVEAFKGRSNKGLIVEFRSGFNWCIEMNGGMQVLALDDVEDRFTTEIRSAC